MGSEIAFELARDHAGSLDYLEAVDQPRPIEAAAAEIEDLRSCSARR